MKWEDYVNDRRLTNIVKNNQRYIRTDIECTKCSALIYKNISIVLKNYQQQ